MCTRWAQIGTLHAKLQVESTQPYPPAPGSYPPLPGASGCREQCQGVRSRTCQALSHNARRCVLRKRAPALRTMPASNGMARPKSMEVAAMRQTRIAGAIRTNRPAAMKTRLGAIKNRPESGLPANPLRVAAIGPNAVGPGSVPGAAVERPPSQQWSQGPCRKSRSVLGPGERQGPLRPLSVSPLPGSIRRAGARRPLRAGPGGVGHCDRSRHRPSI